MDEDYFWRVAVSYVEDGIKSHPIIQERCPANFEKPTLKAVEKSEIPNRFSFPIMGLYRRGTHTIWYYKNDTSVLLHEYTHSLTADWSAACLQEMNAYNVERLYHALDRNQYLDRRVQEYRKSPALRHK